MVKKDQYIFLYQLDPNINFYLLYGNNTGLIEDTINDTLKPNFSKNIFYYEETEILSDPNRFKEEAYNISFFENDKLIIINRGSDKLINIIQELIEKKTKDLVIIIKSGVLEKKSKLRGFFEKNQEINPNPDLLIFFHCMALLNPRLVFS